MMNTLKIHYYKQISCLITWSFIQAANPKELSVIRVAWSPDASYIGK